MNKENTRKLLYIPVILLLALSLVFGYADTHKGDWQGNPEYYEAFER